MSPRTLVLAATAAAALAGCGGGGSAGDSTGTGGTTGAGAAEAVDAVDIKDFAYAPKAAKVKVGQKITFTNRDSAKHDVDFNDKSFESELVGKDGTITFTPTKAGTFDYFCSSHQYMKGSLIVE